MSSLRTFYLVLFLLFSLFHHLSCASSKKEVGWCEAQFQCGHITAGFPFWGGNRPELCGHPLLQLHCFGKHTSLIISNHPYHVLRIDQTSNTLILAIAELHGSFCDATFTAATLPPEIFKLSSNYKNLTVFYLCDPKIPYRSSNTCPDRGLVSVSQDLDYHESCSDSFTTNVPKSYIPEEKVLNLTHLENTLKEGFEVKIDEKACQECKSSHGICGFQNTTHACCEETSPSECKTLHPPNANEHHRNCSGAFSCRGHTGVKIGSAAGVILTMVLVLTLCLRILRKRKIPHDLILQGQRNFKALIPLKQYSYTQVKRITKSFAEVVGRGGFGTVYRGILSDGRSVAVKVLKDSNINNSEDFINEVTSISQTSHVNIVTLLGFCSEGSKRAILYEFLENASLDMFISSKKSSNLNWRELYEIALGVARGIEYLHHGCRTRIVHFDIKPQNVLLDDNLCPKVSDFGLAKLCKREESILSLLDTRGTIGYIAPEVFSRVYGRASYKSDVYSYGMLVLKMIGARNQTSTEDTASSTSSMYFPEWIYKDLEKGDDEEITKKR